MMQYDPNALIIHVDGSAYNNPGGKGGVVVLVEFPADLERENEIIYKESFSGTTNNRMELIACIKAFEWARQNIGLFGVSRVIIITDSEYVYKYQNSAVYWKKSKWRNKEGRAIENRDLWDKFLLAKLKVGVLTEVGWEKGKTSAISKEVDREAKRVAKDIIKTKDYGYRFAKLHRTKIIGGSASMFAANNQEAAIRIYKKEFKDNANKKEYKIFFDIFSEKEKIYTAKYFAYASPEISGDLHRGHIYKIEFGDNPNYPIIKNLIYEIEKYP